MPLSPSDTLAAALNTIREADAARADAAAAMVDLPPYIADALGSRLNTPAHVARLGKVAPFLLGLNAPAPVRLSPHETYGDASILYTIGGDPFRYDTASVDVGDWGATVAALLARHPAIPVSVYKGGCTAIRPDARPSRGENEATPARPIFPVTVTANRTDGYPHTVTLTWWSELTPGVVVRVEVTGQGYNDFTRRVVYRQTNARDDNRRQAPEDRRWEVSHSWGGAPDTIRWWTSPGNPPRVTWTWPVGADFGAVLAPS